MNLSIENKYYLIELIDPLDMDDKHLFTRFSYCGYIKRLIFKPTGKDLLSSVREEFHPFRGQGFPDEFELPVGYDEAQAGEGFIKIGIGLERKKDFVNYTNWDMHEVIQVAQTSIKKYKSKIIFTQNFNFKEYAYNYIKTVSLQDKNIVISHSLCNVGEKIINTLWYSHEFLPINNESKSILLNLPEGYTIYNNGNLLIGTNEQSIIPQKSEILKGTCFNWHVEAEAKNLQFLTDNKDLNYYSCGDFDFDDLQIFILFLQLIF